MGNVIEKRLIPFADPVEKTPCISLGCKLVPVLCREYHHGLLVIEKPF